MLRPGSASRRSNSRKATCHSLRDRVDRWDRAQDPAGRSPPFGRGRVLAWGAVLGTRHCHSRAAAFTEYAFSQFDLLRLYGYVYEWNPASARVMEKAGYACEGRLRQSVMKEGQVIDQFLYAITQ